MSERDPRLDRLMTRRDWTLAQVAMVIAIAILITFGEKLQALVQ